MTYHRRNVHELGKDWSDTLLWYARGVKAMKARGLDSLTSWRFYGAIHGFDADLWEEYGAYTPGEKVPDANDQKTYWNQCQHGSWFFLPWHRGYLIAFEAIVRAEIVKLGGDKDWALPYWNYFKSGQNALPPAFASKNWPDGTGDNPLYVADRFGPDGDGHVFVDLADVDLKALGDARFTSPQGDPTAEFGGVETGFSHGGNLHGGIESQPHDVVHGLVGGQSSSSGVIGLMSMPDTAGLDPIFWLHHCNIDRLWEVWRRNPTTHVDPTNDNWKKGPAIAGERPFTLPTPAGLPWTYTPEDMSDLSTLDYDYDDVSLLSGAALAAAGLPPHAVPMAAAINVAGGPRMKPELIGATSQRLRLVGAEARTTLKLEAPAGAPAMHPLAAAPAMARRYILNLENVRGTNDSSILAVYLNVPDHESAAAHPELRAGTIGLFGIRNASAPDAAHAGDGLSYAVDVTQAVVAMQAAGLPAASGELQVRLVPRRAVAEGDDLSVGRISLYVRGA